MRKLNEIETVAVRLANEIEELRSSVQDISKINVVEVRDKLNFIGGYAMALKAIIEKGAEA